MAKRKKKRINRNAVDQFRRNSKDRAQAKAKAKYVVSRLCDTYDKHDEYLGSPINSRDVIEALMIHIRKRAYERFKGNFALAADYIGITRPALSMCLNREGLEGQGREDYSRTNRKKR